MSGTFSEIAFRADGTSAFPYGYLNVSADPLKMELILMNKDVMIVIAVVVSGAFNLPLWVFLGRRFFGGWAGFWDALRISFSQSFFSALIGEFNDDVQTGMKMAAFVVVCALSFLIPYALMYLWVVGSGCE